MQKFYGINVRGMKFCEKFVRGTKFMQPSPLPWSFRNKGYENFPGFFQNKARVVKLFPLGRATHDNLKGYDLSRSLQTDFFRSSYVVIYLFRSFRESKIYLMGLKRCPNSNLPDLGV